MKVTIKGYLTYKAPEYADEKERFSFVDFKPSGKSAWGVVVREHSFEVEVPDDFDPRPLMIADIDREESELRAAFFARVRELQERRQSLLAIECSEVTQ